MEPECHGEEHSGFCTALPWGKLFSPLAVRLTVSGWAVFAKKGRRRMQGLRKTFLTKPLPKDSSCRRPHAHDSPGVSHYSGNMYLSPSFQRRRVKAGCGVWDHITLDRTDHGWMSRLAPASLRTTFTMSVFP